MKAFPGTHTIGHRLYSRRVTLYGSRGKAEPAVCIEQLFSLAGAGFFFSEVIPKMHSDREVTGVEQQYYCSDCEVGITCEIWPKDGKVAIIGKNNIPMKCFKEVEERQLMPIKCP